MRALTDKHQPEPNIEEMLDADEQKEGEQEEAIPVTLGEHSTHQLTDILACIAHLRYIKDQSDGRAETRETSIPFLDKILTNH